MHVPACSQHYIYTIMIPLCHIILEGGCQFCYSKQPPESTGECNPYEPNSIQLTCQVTGPVGADLYIKWFYKSESTDALTTELHSSSNYFVVVTSVTTTSTRIIKSQMRILNLTVGDYWCRVYHNNNGLLSSQKLGIASEEDYARDLSCVENMSLWEPADKCADIPLPDHLTQGQSSTCPLDELAGQSSGETAAGSYTTRTLIPPTITNIIIGLTSANTYTQLTMETSTIAMTRSSSHTSSTTAQGTPEQHRSTTTTGSVPTIAIRPSSNSASTEGHPRKAGTWLYVVIGLSGVFLFLIFILAAVFILLCLSRPANKRGM